MNAAIQGVGIVLGIPRSAGYGSTPVTISDHRVLDGCSPVPHHENEGTHVSPSLNRMIGTVDFPEISHVKKRAFLAAFSRCGSLSKAAKRARVDRRTHYNWLAADPWYVHAFRQAMIEAGDSLQDRLTEMAFEGNVTAAIFLLKGLKPETFRDRIEQVNIQDIEIDKLSPEILDKIADHLLAKAVGNDPNVIAETRRQLEAGMDPTAVVVTMPRS
jgi:hypothetical protein